MTSQLKIAKQSLINKHKLYRNSSKTVTNFFPYPQINQCVHVISNCEIVKNDNQENILTNNNGLNLPNNFRLQTKITPIYTKNHGYPRLVQEFQFFVNDAIIKYTNVTTSMPNRKDDAFMCQMENFTHKNPINDYYFDLANQPKPEEGKIIEEEEEERVNTVNLQKNSNSSISSEQLLRFELPHENSCCCFKDQANKKHPYGHQATCSVFTQAPNNANADGQILREGSLSGISLSLPPIPEQSSDLPNADDNDKPKSKNSDNFDNDNKINNQEKWRGERCIPDNKEEKKEIFKVVKKRICKYDRKINGCCAGETKLGCKVN